MSDVSQIDMNDSASGGSQGFTDRILQAKRNKQVRQQIAEQMAGARERAEVDRRTEAEKLYEARMAEQAAKAEEAQKRRRVTELVMPEQDNAAVKVGSLTIVGADDGGPFDTSRIKVAVITADGKRNEHAPTALYALYCELRSIQAQAKAARK